MSDQVEIFIQPTPNPNALKFILDKPVKLEGNSTYRSPVECGENLLAYELFKIRGIDQVHFFDTAITITKFGYEDWENIEEKLMNTIKENFPKHNPDYHDPDPEADRRAALSPELQDIEKSLIKPSVQASKGMAAISWPSPMKIISYSLNIRELVEPVLQALPVL